MDENTRAASPDGSQSTPNRTNQSSKGIGAPSANGSSTNDKEIAQAFAGLLAREPDETKREAWKSRVQLLAAFQAHDEAFSPVNRVKGRDAAAIKPRRIHWLRSDRIPTPLGCLIVGYGEEGLGKGVAAVELASGVTTGTLEGVFSDKPQNVDWITFEDDPDTVLVPRLKVAGADLSRIKFHDGYETMDSLLTLPDDIPALTLHLEERDTKLLVINPLGDALSEKLKDNNNGDVRKALVPLQNMAKELGIAVIGILHPNKGATRAADKLMGSKACRSVPRYVWMLGRDPEDEHGDTRIVTVSKSNVSGTKSSMKVRIVSAWLEEPDADGKPIGSVPKLEWIGESKFTDADLVTFGATGKVAGPDHAGMSQKAKAQAIIIDLLNGLGGSVTAEQAYAAGEAAGIPEATMRRARQELKIPSDKHVWTIPEDWEPGMDL